MSSPATSDQESDFARLLADSIDPPERKIGWTRREKQMPPPGGWFIWLIMAGRGWGKTKTGAQWLMEEALAGGPGDEYAVIARTTQDCRRTCIEGRTGLLAALGWTKEHPSYNRTTGEIRLPNGAVIHSYTAEKPDGIRGPNFSAVWADELAAWRYFDIWHEGVIPATRIGNPRIVVTTTPRPVPLLRGWLERTDESVYVTRGATWENEENLSSEYLAEMQRSLPERLLRQEMYGDLIEDVDGALWTLGMLDRGRVSEPPEMSRIVVAIDPAVSSGTEADDTGIVVAGRGVDGHGYVLADLTCHLPPEGWATKAVKAYEDWQADTILGEVNNGGEMVEHTIRTVRHPIPFKAVHASRGKQVRAQPIAALYGGETRESQIHHVGSFPELEDELTTWIPGVTKKSPDRLDALVWAMTDLMVTGRRPLGQFSMDPPSGSKWRVG